MKISYFLKCIGLLALFSGTCAAEFSDESVFSPFIGLHVEADDSPYGDLTTDKKGVNGALYGQSAIGILIDSDASMGDVKSTIISSNLNWALAWGIYLEDGGQMGTVSGTIETYSNLCTSVGYLGGTLDHYDAIGLYAETTNDSTGIDVDWSCINLNINRGGEGEDGTVYGIYLNDSCASITDTIGGTITSNTYGSNISGLSIGIVLENGTSIAGISGKVTATTDDGSATGLLIRDSSIGTISGTITAKSDSDMANATAIDYNTTQQIVLEGATIRAMTKTNGVASYGAAIKNTDYGISLLSTDCSTAATIKGNLDAGAHALEFQSGQFDVASESWTASVVTVGSDAATAQVTLESDLGIEATTLEFYINGLDDVSSITISTGYTLDLSDIDTINVYITDGVMESGEFDLTLMDGAIACMSDDVQVHYILSDLYTGESLSYGSADDGTSFIVSYGGSSGGGDLPAVPEPTTATLSLLALAGLVARRRRA